MRRAAFAVVVAVVLASSGPSLAVALQQAAVSANVVSPIAIPFELATNHIIVKARVNKSRPLSFVLDTGASTAVARMDTARELGLRLEGAINGRGAGPGTQVGSRVRDATWSLVGLDGFSQPVSLALPLPALPSSLGRDIDGIIGGEFIRQFVVEVDYQAGRLTLHDRGTFAYRGNGETLPIEFDSNGHPVLRATVTPLNRQPISERFLLDIGSGQALILHSPFVTEQRLPGPEVKTIRAIGGTGIGGRTTGRRGRVSSLQIGSFTIESPVTLFSEDTAGAFANRSLAGNIGAQIASRFRMFLDYTGRRIILEPSSTFGDTFDRAFSGVVLRAEGPDYHIFRVQELLEDSPATEAGLAEGDIITSIDGRSAEALTLSAVNELFEKPVAYRLTIRRADQTVLITLTPRGLI